jgi:transposase-like protein
VPALQELLGSAAGLSAWVITRLTTQWQAERQAFTQRDLQEVDYVCCWADGVHFSVRPGDQGRLCCLVIVGVRADGRKELVAVADGTRESTDDWAELLRDLRRRGMRAPVVLVGDGRWGCGGHSGSLSPDRSRDAGSIRSERFLMRCQECPHRRASGLERGPHGRGPHPC